MTMYSGAAQRAKDEDYERLAKLYDIDEAKLRAVMQVEARNSGYSGNSVIALYEPHIAWKYSSGSVRNALAKAGLAYPKWGTVKYPKSSYHRIDEATRIAGAEIAALSTSWGLGQLMGFNHEAAGFLTAVKMVEAFAESEVNQVEAMIRFIQHNHGMAEALKQGDWENFARLYNGAGYKKNGYHAKLANAYRVWSGFLSRSKPDNLTVVAKTTIQPEPKPAPKPIPVEPIKMTWLDKVKSFFKGKSK